MARPRKQDERRADLVEAALTAVGEHGLRSLSLADVAEKAGLTRGAILYYYEDLDALLVEAHRAGLERFCDHRDAVVAAIAEPQLQLAAAIREGLPSGPDDALMRLLYEFDVLAGTSQLHDELVERMYLRQLATYTGILERGVSAGVFAPRLEIATLAMNLVALEDAYGLHIVAGNSLITVESARAAMVAAAEGLGAPTRV
ncbi:MULTISPECIES: TetR/AcrR family transcriptional regulator [unclassified Leifsonia]|mgnify:CR=1 FL=1|uniref:TetR/AcrR family transcriptional regulator n=1 Tax=unclassified Leifsonia TaxID=2663824 RepID=UPI00092AEA80|nr:TetR family transcriptional regulator [Leifsonia sp. 71-9]OJX73970.1 MAG: TetR family transcriptional regulator [Leifsonia sp. 71-9]